MKDAFAQFVGNSPATEASISAVEMQMGCHLPVDYGDFLLNRNGGEGFISDDSFLRLWQVENLLQFNRDYLVPEYCPELLMIGTDGGGEAYAFDRRKSPWAVVQIPFMDLDYSACWLVGFSFLDFIENLCHKRPGSI